MIKNKFYIWEGIYDHFPADHSHRVFESERWVKTVEKSTIAQSEATISFHTLIHEYPMPPVIALLTANMNRPLRILDFGGGLGNSYFPLINSIPAPESVDYHIVESAAICKRGCEIYRELTNLHFHSQLPQDIKKFDIIHTAAALHYVADWQNTLKRFSDYQPHIIMLFGLTAGDIDTFVTNQNYYDFKVPVWFWNVNEIIDQVSQLGYKLIYKSLLASSYLGKIQPLPMDNFPPSHQLSRKCNLIFYCNHHKNT